MEILMTSFIYVTVGIVSASIGACIGGIIGFLIGKDIKRIIARWEEKE